MILTDTPPVTREIPDSILSLNFERIKHKLANKPAKEAWSKSKIDQADKEYRRYLTMILLNPSTSIVPSQLMDEFWHQHILDTKAYREDCHKVFGKFIDHFPYFGIYGEEDRQNLLSSFEETKLIYYATFGHELGDNNASRCEDHPCHVESDCACRAAGTCKDD